MKLALYYTPWCPYCVRVLSAIESLGADVELRNTASDAAHQKALLAARGRGTVPVLRIAQAGEEDVWMPESADIIAFLRAQSS